MGTVIHLEERREAKISLDMLEQICGILSTITISLEQGYAHISNMEEQLDNAQTYFNELLKESIDIMGIEKVGLNILSYAEGSTLEITEEQGIKYVWGDYEWIENPTLKPE